MKADDIMKLHIKEQPRKISYLDETNSKPPSELAKTKGAPKKVKPTQSDNSTRQSLSYFEHVDSHFPDSPTPKSQKSVFKDARIIKPSTSPPSPKISIMKKCCFFMHKYIERVKNVGGGDNCGFRAVSGLFKKGDDDYQFVCFHLIQKIRTHRESYIKLYLNKANYNAILNVLVPCFSGTAPFDKWMRLPKMRHLITSAYDRVCIALTRYGFSETFLSLRSKPPQNPSEHIICIGWLSKTQHFSYLFVIGMSYTIDITGEDDTFHTRC
ncbi:uncharacterized protein LOC131625468 [Vicia villosa]|uniref:uncharacterized protein LOC131625468 n=1 Tax=Vicia villosa TaxID=3911 RepID=UPI00273B45B1|nr:uncharacterized protein LOC131625468 [Vicia villosa]